MLQPGSQSHLSVFASCTEQALDKKCNERQCWEARDSVVLSVECSLLHNHTCPASLRFPMDFAGFGVDSGRKTVLSLPSLACSL